MLLLPVLDFDLKLFRLSTAFKVKPLWTDEWSLPEGTSVDTHTCSRGAALKFEKDCVRVLALFMQTLIMTLENERRKTSLPFSELYSVSVSSQCVSLNINNQE